MTNHWTDHFAGNFSWSNATMVTKGMAPYGVIALGEIERIGEKLAARQNEPDAWWQEWCAMADRVAGMADEAAARGRQLTAGDYYMRAGYYYYTGERMVHPGELKTEIYDNAIRCFNAGFERRYPDFERVEVPYEGASLPAYFIKARGAAGRAPTVVVFDGLDNCKEMSALFCGLEFSRRGFNTLAIDGPGQGETLRLRGITSRYDYEVPGTAAYDYVAGRGDVDPNKVVILGYSFGGYCVPRIAAFEKRYAGGVAFGAMYWDMHAWLLRTQEQMKKGAVATSHFQIPWVFGVPGLEFAGAIERMKQFTLAGVAEKVSCPFLTLHGENDRIIPPGEAKLLHEALGTKNKTLKIFDAEEGGAEHCQVDDRQAGVNFIADWIAENVVASG
ncbi:MAG: alpha/beta fold hydrolase [Xanthobacteraceae bacterium]